MPAVTIGGNGGGACTRVAGDTTAGGGTRTGGVGVGVGAGFTADLGASSTVFVGAADLTCTSLFVFGLMMAIARLLGFSAVFTLSLGVGRPWYGAPIAPSIGMGGWKPPGIMCPCCGIMPTPIPAIDTAAAADAASGWKGIPAAACGGMCCLGIPRCP